MKNIIARLLGKKTTFYTWKKEDMIDCIGYFFHKKYYVWKITKRIPSLYEQNHILFGD